MRKPAMPLARRFHRRPGAELRYWERAVFIALHSLQPERRLWANVLADALYAVYRYRSTALVVAELDWLFARTAGSLMHFDVLAGVFDINPDDVRRDVLADVNGGKIKAKVTYVEDE